MGQIIQFPTQPTPYPNLATELSTADCVLLLAMRWWVEDYRAGVDPVPRLQAALENADAVDAAFSIDSLMSIVARTGRRAIAVNCPRCPNLSGDEKQLLHAASLTQASNGGLAEKTLRTALLSAEGAAFAVGALEGLGDLFGKARLFFARLASPGLTFDADDREAWAPSLH
jgi:hypothetical protein